MVETQYIPDRGDFIWIDFDPQSGREQSGTRPAIVLSSVRYNSRSRLVILCPITSQVKGYPFECPIADGFSIKGVILADQVRSSDWHTRNARFISKAPNEIIEKVTAYATGIMQGK